jgi:hypothetical protein
MKTHDGEGCMLQDFGKDKPRFICFPNVEHKEDLENSTRCDVYVYDGFVLFLLLLFCKNVFFNDCF